MVALNLLSVKVAEFPVLGPAMSPVAILQFLSDKGPETGSVRPAIGAHSFSLSRITAEEEVVQSIAHQVEGQHGLGDGQTGE